MTFGIIALPFRRLIGILWENKLFLQTYLSKNLDFYTSDLPALDTRILIYDAHIKFER